MCLSCGPGPITTGRTGSEAGGRADADPQGGEMRPPLSVPRGLALHRCGQVAGHSQKQAYFAISESHSDDQAAFSSDNED